MVVVVPLFKISKIKKEELNEACVQTFELTHAIMWGAYQNH